jgi:hypothetical protein
MLDGFLTLVLGVLALIVLLVLYGINASCGCDSNGFNLGAAILGAGVLVAVVAWLVPRARLALLLVAAAVMIAALFVGAAAIHGDDNPETNVILPILSSL